MSRFLVALVLGVGVLASTGQASAQPDRYLLVPQRCCRQRLAPVHPVPLQPVVRTVERRVYVTPPPPVELRRERENHFVMGLVTGFRRPVLQTGAGTGVLAGARIAGDFGWLSFGLRFDFTHFEEEDQYRMAFEWRFIARRHEMFRPYVSFAPGFSALRVGGETRFGFGVESELGLLMHHDTTHGALRITLGATGSAAYLPTLRRSLVDVGIRASIGFAFDG